MQELKFDAGRPTLADIGDGFFHILFGFSRKSQDHMRDHFQSACPEIFHSLVINRKRISSANVCSRSLMDRLQTHFHPKRFDLIQF